jgi:hypothetical protein
MPVLRKKLRGSELSQHGHGPDPRRIPFLGNESLEAGFPRFPRIREVVMRRIFSVAVIAVAVIVGALIIPGGRISAANPDPVQVTNVPLPVTVGNFPETVRVGGTVGAAQSGPWAVQQSGPWTVNLSSPTPLVYHQLLIIQAGDVNVDSAPVAAPAGAIIETVSIEVSLPTGQRGRFFMRMYDENGKPIGLIFVPLQFELSEGGFDNYVGTLTNLGIRSGTLARKVDFRLFRGGSTETVFGNLTMTGSVSP